MDYKQLLKIIDLLREKSDNNKLVVFVGAGVSRNVPGLPSWNQLVDEMAKAIGYSKCDTCSHKTTCKDKCLIANDYSADELIKIPQYVFNHNQTLYLETLQKNIVSPSCDAPLSEAIFQLNPNHIITTNYDKLLESSSCLSRKQYDVIVSNKDLLEAQKSKYIIKMHGDIADLKSIVLKEQDYLEYSQKHVLIELFVKALLTDHVILFVGYSLNDINVKLIVGWINYLRSQNKSITKNKRIGYIVLDEPNIDSNTVSYFQNNNIEVINCYNFPLVQNIPKDLTNPRGQRLYSFLKVISDPWAEDRAFPVLQLEKIIDFLTEHRTTDWFVLLSKLHICSYELIDSCLILYNDNDFKNLESFFQSKSKQKDKLYQLFANVGIKKIRQHSDASQIITIDKTNELFVDPFFSAYIQNDYCKLNSLCKHESDINKKYFYQFFLNGYNSFNENDIENYPTNTIQSDLVKIYNIKAIRFEKEHKYDFSEIQHYLDSIPSTQVKKIYHYFEELYNGNHQKRLKMSLWLNQLKNQASDKNTVYFGKGGPIHEIYNLQNQIIAHYYFVYNNHLLPLGIRDTSDIFRIYVEGIVCTSSDTIEQEHEVFGMKTYYEKYYLTPIDIDIITKKTSSKELYKLLIIHKVSSFSLNRDIVQHTIRCFINLSQSIIKYDIYGYKDNNLDVLCNLALILTKCELATKEHTKLARSLYRLFSNDNFNQHFWHYNPDHKTYIKVLSMLCNVLPPKYNINSINSIISSSGFYETIANISIYDIRNIIEFFLPETINKNDEQEFISIIDNESDIQKKFILLFLMRKRIKTKSEKKKYTRFLSEHFTQIPVHYLYEFIFNKWLIPSKDNITSLINDIIEKHKTKVNGITIIPDPVESKLECVYILYLNKYIDDISELDYLCKDYPHLHFFLHPDTFDYNHVDFSDYMWENIARHKQYMRIFIKHKNELIPKIKKRINTEDATEFEIKVLYGFLLDKNEILS